MSYQLTIEVVSTASLDVRLKAIPYNSSTGKVVAPNDPNHTEYLIVIEKVDIVMLDKISNVGTNVGATSPDDIPIYHRLVVTKPVATGPGVTDGTSFLVLDSGLVPDVGAGYVDTINLTPETALITTNRKFYDATSTTPTVGSAPPAMNADGVRYRRLGYVHRDTVDLTVKFKFELQYQIDPMTAGNSVGRVFTNTSWNTFQQQSNQDILVQSTSGDAYNVRMTYLNDDTLPMTTPFGHIYAKNTTLPPSISFLTAGGDTLSFDQVAQGVAAANSPAYTGYPASVASILNGAGGSTGSIDYVIVLNDETSGDGIVTASIVDDVDAVLIPAYPEISIAPHLVTGIKEVLSVWTPGPLISDPTDIKVFRGRETRIYTDLFFSSVHFSSYDLQTGDNDILNAGVDDLNIACRNGYLDFDAGGTRVGINIDSSRGNVVYLLLLIGNGSNGVNLDGLYLRPGAATAKLMGAANATFLDRTNYNSGATNPIKDG